MSAYETIFQVSRLDDTSRFAHRFLIENLKIARRDDALLVRDVIIGTIRATEARDDASRFFGDDKKETQSWVSAGSAINSRLRSIGPQDLAALNSATAGPSI